MTIIVMIRLAVPQFSSVVTPGEKVSPEKRGEVGKERRERERLTDSQGKARVGVLWL